MLSRVTQPKSTSIDNKLTIDCTKLQFLSIKTIGENEKNNQCNTKRNVKNLGFEIDDKLNFNYHVKVLCEKLSKL